MNYEDKLRELRDEAEEKSEHLDADIYQEIHYGGRQDAFQEALELFEQWRTQHPNQDKQP